MNTHYNKTFLHRLCILITCILMLSVIAIVKDGSILGYQVAGQSNEELNDTATVQVLNNGLVIVNSTNIAKDVQGYAGPVPMKVYVKDGCIDSIEVLKNSETPEFLDRVKGELICQYIGKNVREARNMKIDAVSGATYSSRAVIETLKKSLAQVPDSGDGVGDDMFGTDCISLAIILAVLVALGAAIIPFYYKKGWYRKTQLALNVIILGLYAGTFVSYSSMTGVLAHGFGLQNIALLILLAIAFIYPLFGKKGYYCAWACPLGSAQELIGKTNKRKISLGRTWTNRLLLFRKCLGACLLILAWTNICLEWMDYELFTAFLWQSASWIVIALAVIVLILSAFISRPYCRFICPTGIILKAL